MKNFLKATLIGGLLFLLPAMLIAFLLGSAVRMATKVSQPVSNMLELDRLGSVGGMGAATLLAIVVLVVVSFAAGVVARTRPGRSLSQWFEDSLLSSLPQYRLVKSVAEGMMHLETSTALKPALVSIEEGWQIGYELERLDNGWVAVFLPQAPTPMSGNVMYFPEARVRPLGITLVQAMAVVKKIGVGSGDALRGVDLRQPSGG